MKCILQVKKKQAVYIEVQELPLLPLLTIDTFNSPVCCHLCISCKHTIPYNYCINSQCSTTMDVCVTLFALCSLRVDNDNCSLT